MSEQFVRPYQYHGFVIHGVFFQFGFETGYGEQNESWIRNIVETSGLFREKVVVAESHRGFPEFTFAEQFVCYLLGGHLRNDVYL